MNQQAEAHEDAKKVGLELWKAGREYRVVRMDDGARIDHGDIRTAREARQFIKGYKAAPTARPL